MKKKDKLYQITLTEKQLCVMIEALEDWHRFVCGQCTMDNATSYLPNKQMRETREILQKQVERAIFPELSLNSSYSWHGGHKDNPAMSEVAAITYMLYRELRHQLCNIKGTNSGVYSSPTLTDEQQGRMVTLEEYNKEKTYNKTEQ